MPPLMIISLNLGLDRRTDFCLVGVVAGPAAALPLSAVGPAGTGRRRAASASGGPYSGGGGLRVQVRAEFNSNSKAAAAFKLATYLNITELPVKSR